MYLIYLFYFYFILFLFYFIFILFLLYFSFSFYFYFYFLFLFLFFIFYFYFYFYFLIFLFFNSKSLEKIDLLITGVYIVFLSDFDQIQTIESQKKKLIKISMDHIFYSVMYIFQTFSELVKKTSNSKCLIVTNKLCSITDNNSGKIFIFRYFLFFIFYFCLLFFNSN